MCQTGRIFYVEAVALHWAGSLPARPSAFCAGERLYAASALLPLLRLNYRAGWLTAEHFRTALEVLTR